MWVGRVEYPSSLVEAHRTGHLVFFVGAGASCDPPSGLPLFNALTDEIIATAMVTIEEGNPDVRLGELNDEHEVDVHQRVRDLLSIPESKPNRLHEAIVELAMSAGPYRGQSVRIVTTNYDRHLSTVLRRQPFDLPEYSAPALPMGNDFTGLVYLHGDLDLPPKRLIVTDEDFGRAYLLDAWASRFLERMHNEYVVLFIGYSHDDVVMSYLGRGLGRRAERYILSSNPDRRQWRRLRVTPIGYPMVGATHVALGDALERWATLASWGLLDHRARAEHLLGSSPPREPEDLSYLDALVADDSRVGFFTEIARGPEWLSWVQGQPAFEQLFDGSINAESVRHVALANWFVEHYVLDEVLSTRALSTLRDLGATFGRTLWNSLGWQLHRADKPRPAWLSPWVTMLIDNDPGVSQPWLDYALDASRWPLEQNDALLLFDHLIEPKLAFWRTYGTDDDPRFDITVRGDKHHLRGAWENVFKPNLADAAPAIMSIADRQLRRAHQLLASASPSNPTWDPVSFSRSAIEPSHQDLGGDLDTLIDAARDSLEALLEIHPTLGVAYLDSWSGTTVPLLRRLSIHGWIHRTDVDCTTKLDWLLQQGWLFDHQLHHEVFRLLATCAASASHATSDAILDAILAGDPSVDEDEYQARQQFEVLSWIESHGGNGPRQQQTLEDIRVKYPQWKSREHPDHLAWFSVGSGWPTRADISAHDLRELIQSSPTSAVDRLIAHVDEDHPLLGPSMGAQLAVLAEVVQNDPDAGFLLLEAQTNPHRAIVGAVIQGWTRSDTDPDTKQAIIDRLGALNLNTYADDISRLLANERPGQARPSPWAAPPAARKLAMEAWRVLEKSDSDITQDGWLSRAINRPAGRLTSYWLEAVTSEWTAAGDRWHGLTPELRDGLHAMLTGDDARSRLAEVIVAADLSFLFSADREWCESNVLLLFDWADSETAARAWDGYLHNGRWNDELLEVGLLDYSLQTAGHLGHLRAEMVSQLLSYLAGITLHSELDLERWLAEITVKLDVTHRVEWMTNVAWGIQRLEPAEYEQVWTRRLKDYWQARLSGTPRTLTFEEASAMAPWALHLTTSLGEGVRLATSARAGFVEHPDWLHRLHEGKDALSGTIATFIAHLLSNTTGQFWAGHYFVQIIPRLQRNGAPEDINTIIEALVRLGYSDASNWLNRS